MSNSLWLHEVEYTRHPCPTPMPRAHPNSNTLVTLMQRDIIEKEPDVRKDWGQEEKGTTEDEMVGWHHWLNGHEFGNSGSWCWTGRPGMLQFMGSQRVGHEWATELNWTELRFSTGFPSVSVVKNPPASTGDPGSTPGLGKCPRVGNGYSLQFFCLENCMDRGTWSTTVYRVAKSKIPLND